MGTARRSHKKSRTGCQQCKAKRIKCDEHIPCSNCARWDTECSLSTNPAAISAAASQASSPASYRTTPQPQAPIPPNHFNLTDFVLFHHFMTKTSEAMQDDLSGPYPWVDSIASEATQCPYLMHEILAVAAIHLKTLPPQQQHHPSPLDYERLAQEHQSRALSLFRAALASSDGAALEAGRLFTCSSLIVRFYFVAIEDPASLLFRDDDDDGSLPEWIPPLRGCVALAQQFGDALATHPLGGLFHSSSGFWVDDDGGPAAPRRPSESDNQMQLLEHQLAGMTTPDEQAAVYGPALARLRDCFAVSELGSDLAAKAGAFAFPARVAQDFLTALCRDKHPASLVIMAHWCVLLQRIYPKWWIRTATTVADMLQAIRVRLPGPEWEELIHWPMSQIFVPGATGKGKMLGIDPSLSG